MLQISGRTNAWPLEGFGANHARLMTVAQSLKQANGGTIRKWKATDGAARQLVVRPEVLLHFRMNWAGLFPGELARERRIFLTDEFTCCATQRFESPRNFSGKKSVTNVQELAFFLRSEASADSPAVLDVPQYPGPLLPFEFDALREEAEDRDFCRPCGPDPFPLKLNQPEVVYGPSDPFANYRFFYELSSAWASGRLHFLFSVSGCPPVYLQGLPKMLEIGCGYGTASIMSQPFRFLSAGIDINRRRLEGAAGISEVLRNRGYSFDGLNFILGDITAPPAGFDIGGYDLATIYGPIGVSDSHLRVVLKALRPGALVCQYLDSGPLSVCREGFRKINFGGTTNFGVYVRV